MATQLPPIARRVLEIEDALASALNHDDFEVVTVNNERFLRPILAGLVSDADAIKFAPLLPLDQVARDLERLLS